MSCEQNQTSFFRIFTVSLLVTGTSVGAGILALPIQMGQAGLIPALVDIFLIWTTMLITGFILAHRLSPSSQAADLATLFERDIGPVGKWLCALGYFLVFYGVLVAYLSGATSMLINMIPLPVPRLVWLVVFFIVATGLTLFGEELVRRGNAMLMMVLLLSFAVLIAQAGNNINMERFHYIDWWFMPSAIPIVVCAFAYHQIIPTVCRCLDWNSKNVCWALFLGTSIALIMNVLWVVVVLGAIPLDGPGNGTLIAAFQGNVPATVPLSLVLQSKTVTTAGVVFTFVAILTSYLGVGIALIGFIQDFASSIAGTINRRTAAFLGFAPPLIVGIIYPNIFLKVLNLVGGMGNLLLFAILPVLVFIRVMSGKSTRRRMLGYSLLIVLTLLMILEIAQECGWLHIEAEREYWNSCETKHLVHDPE